MTSNTLAQELHRVTAYSHGCTLPRDGKEFAFKRPAANGEWPIINYTVAADWSLYPPGTEIIIENEGIWKVTDKGHAIKGRAIDLFFAKCSDAKLFGVRYLKVWKVPTLTTKESNK